MTSASDGRAIRRCNLAKARTSISAHAFSSMCDRIRRLAMPMPLNRTSHAAESAWKARSGTWWHSRSTASWRGRTGGATSTRTISSSVRAGARRTVQAAVQPGREHESNQPGFRLPVAGRARAGTGPRSRRHGSRPAARSDRALRAGSLRSGRPQRSDAEPGTRLRWPYACRSRGRAALQELEVDRRRISRPGWRSRRATSAWVFAACAA